MGDKILKKVLVFILSISIVLKIILGYKMYTIKNRLDTQNEVAFYNYCKNIGCIFEDLDQEIFKTENKNQMNSEYMKQSISKNVKRFVDVERTISKLSKSDNRIKKISSEYNFYLIDDYFISLAMIVEENIPLNNEDISILHEVIDKGKTFGIYGYSSENYKKELDPEHPPLDKIAKLYQDIGRLCDKGNKKLEAKSRK